MTYLIRDPVIPCWNILDESEFSDLLIFTLHTAPVSTGLKAETKMSVTDLWWIIDPDFSQHKRLEKVMLLSPPT